MRRYISRQKLLLKKEVCGATSHVMDKLIVVKHQVDRTQLLIVIYTYMYLPYFHHNKMVTRLLTSLLQCIGQNFCMYFIQNTHIFY